MVRFKAITKDYCADKPIKNFEVTGLLKSVDGVEFDIEDDKGASWMINPSTLEIIGREKNLVGLDWAKCTRCGNIKTLHEEIPKRKPDSNGVLPLTSEELEEFAEIINFKRENKNFDIGRVAVADDILSVQRTNNGIHCGYIWPDSVKAILYLAERFNLNGGE